MTVERRRASVIALVVLALVVASLVLPVGGTRTTPPNSGGTVAAGTPAPAATTTAPAPGASATADTTPLPPAPASVDRDLDLSGVIVDPDGTPVAGATVQAVFHPVRTTWFRGASPWGALGPVTRSGDDGEFALRLLRGQKAGLRVTAAGFATCEREPATAGSRLRIVVRPAVSCVVTLRDPALRPVAGRTVRIRLPQSPPGVLLHREGVSDEHGRVQFDDLPGGLLVTTFPSAGPPGLHPPATVALPLRGSLEVEVSAPSGRPRQGRITDSRTGLPIPGARILLAAPRCEETTTADDDGNYSFRSVPEPSRSGSDDTPRFTAPSLRVEADGYIAASATVPADGACDVSLVPAATLTGRAVDRAGKPVSRAWVFLERWSGGHGAPVGRSVDWDSTPAATTDADGRFRISTRARYDDVRVEAAGFAPRDRRVPRAEPRPGPIDVGDLVLSPGLMLEGQVSDGEGRPMAGVRVNVDGETCMSDDLGRYRARDLTPGRHHVVANSNGRGAIARNVTLAPGAGPTVLDLAFPAGREVTIEVADGDGAAVAGAGLVVEGHVGRSVTDEHGRATLIVPADLQVVRVDARHHIHADGRSVFVPRKFEIPADTSSVVVALHRTPPPEDVLPIAGVVVDDDGRPVDGVRLSVTWSDGAAPIRRPEQVQSRDDGRFDVRVPKGAVCDIRAHSRVLKTDRSTKSPGWEAWEGELTGVPAGRTDVVVASRRDPRERAASFLVLAPDGAPLEHAVVWIEDLPGGRVHAVTGEDGRATLSGLPHTLLSAAVSPPAGRAADWLREGSPRFVPDGQEITVRLRRAAHILGVVTYADGSPARDAYVRVSCGAAPQSARVGGGGRFRVDVDADAPLPWRLTAGLVGELPPIETTVDLTAPPTTDVILRLPVPAPR